MIDPVAPRTRVRFGDFDFDPSARELRRAGEIVKLQDQPMRMLAILVERAGEVVPREEFRNQLWPNGTFVEFDHSLNTATRKLRQALGDDSDQPSFVETIPKRGYRFIAEVEHLQPSAEVAAVPSPRARGSRLSKLSLTLGLAGAAAIATLVLWFDARGRPSAEFPVPQFRRLTADAGLSWEPAASRDGQLIAFSSDRAESGNLDIWLMQVNGADPIRLTNDPADDVDPDFCPDGRIVFRSDRGNGGVFIMPALGGSPVLLASGGRHPRCSPDGRWVAFSIGTEMSVLENTVYVVPVTGGPILRVAPELARCQLAVWSRDSSKLLIFGYPERTTPWNQAEWFLAPIEGGAAQQINVRGRLGSRLNFQVGTPFPEAWVGSTSEVLFSATPGQRDYATTQASLWSVLLEPGATSVRGPARQITASPGLHVTPAAADNGTLAFADVELNPDIWAVPINHGRRRVTGSLERITADRYWESRPSVCADESAFVVRSDRGGGWDFWQLDLQSSQFRPISISREAKVFAPLNRDCTKLAWRSGSAVYIAELRTGAVRQLCASCDADPSDWTHDDTLLVTLPARNSIGFMSTRDGAIQEIIRPTATALGGAAMSRDDRFIAFTSGIESAGRSEDDGKLMIAPVTNAPIRRELWTEVGATASVPRWSPDGRSLYFTSTRDGWNCVWAVGIDAQTGRVSRPVEPVMHFHQRRFALRGSYAVSKNRLFVGLHETTANIWVGARDRFHE